MRYTITAPSPVTGQIVGLTFVLGVAEADADTHRRALGYFRRNGQYRIEPLDTEPPAAEEPKPPARSASTEAWRTYAAANGMTADEAGGLSRDELAERFLGPKEA